MKIDSTLTAGSLDAKITRLFELSAEKISSIDRSWRPEKGTPVFTVRGEYTSRGWTEWTQGFQFGAAFLQFEATGDKTFLEQGQERTRQHMASHVSHIGVHDHGFNNISTYGNWWRLINDGVIPERRAERDFVELALKISGAVQAARWSPTRSGSGYIYSFNGPQSLFIDTMRSLRSLAVAHQLGHALMGERDEKISLLERLVRHGQTTAEYMIWYGTGRDAYDLPGRTAHEGIFNANNGDYRCPNSQQGYSPFSTWTRGLAWAICGFAEQLEFINSRPERELEPFGGKGAITETFLKAARVTSEFYIANSCADGVPIWDTGAPNIARLGDYPAQASDPFNAWEPVDSSAAAIAAQGLLRLSNFLAGQHAAESERYRQAAFTITNTLFQEPYLSTSSEHQGLLLHSVYHRPNGWDYIHEGQSVPNNESSMWGDYHARELALMILREAQGRVIPTFFRA